MEALNSETTEEEIGKIEACWHERDPDIGKPDDGDITEAVGDQTKDINFSDEIGKPAQGNEIDEKFDAFVGKPKEDSDNVGPSGNDGGTFKAIGDPSKECCAKTRQNTGKKHGKKKDLKKRRRDSSKPPLHAFGGGRLLEPVLDDGCDGGGAEHPAVKNQHHTLSGKVGGKQREKPKDEKIQKNDDHLNSVGSDGKGNVHLKDLLFLIMIFTLIESSAGGPVHDLYAYRCWNFETEDPKISFRESKITIRRVAEDVCKQRSDGYISCIEGSLCFLINKQNVMFCHNDKNAGNFTMIDEWSTTTIYPSEPEDLPLNVVKSLQQTYHPSTPNPTTTPSTTPDHHLPPQGHQNHETRNRFGAIATVLALGVVICCVLCCMYYKRRYAHLYTPNDQRNDSDLKKEGEPALNEEAKLINNTEDNDSVQSAL